MIARRISSDRPEDLELAFARMGLPRSARDYLMDRVPAMQLLMTGLSDRETRFFRDKAHRQEIPGREEFPTFIAGDPRRRPGTALLSGRREQFDRLLHEAHASPEQVELAKALGELLEAPRSPLPLVLGDRTFAFGARTYVMGVVNVTPDSFSDGGRFLDPETAVAHGAALAKAGADLLDVGGESTRPGSNPVTVEEELRRVLPVIRGLRRSTEVPLSVDTTKAAVARAALAEGACLVNDVSGFSFDSELPAVVGAAGAACCLMHIRGTPRTMQEDPRYDDLVDEVLTSLRAAVARAATAGVPRERILVDPGIGFGKTLGHNLFLLRRLVDLRSLGLPVVVGPSRKGFLGSLTGGKAPTERLAATLGSVAAIAAWGGADVVRVHDVGEVKDALAVVDAIRGAAEGGALF